MGSIKSVNLQKQQRNFYLLLAGAGIAFSVLQFYKNRLDLGRGLIGAAVFFLVIEFVIPPLGRIVFRAWMAFAHLLGWLNTRILLTLIFFLMITPIGILKRTLSRGTPYDPASCRKRQSAWFPLEDTHRYTAPY